jgi:hypothetical protein
VTLNFDSVVAHVNFGMFIKDMSNMPTLSPSQRDILTANGESLKVAGKTIIEIQSDNFKCLNEAVVAIHFPVYHYFTLWRYNNGFRNRDPVTPDLPLNIKLNFVTLDCDSVSVRKNT